MLTDCQNLFTGRFAGEYPTKSSSIIPPHRKRVAALLRETSVSENCRKFDACVIINDKSQSSVATRLRCGGYAFIVEFAGQAILKSVNIWRSYRQEVTNRPLIMQKQYLFFCVEADAYCHTVGG